MHARRTLSERPTKPLLAAGCALLFALALALAPEPAHATGERLRARGTLATGARVDACTSPAQCETWVRYPARPSRTIHAVEASSSGRFFFVWSTPDGGSRELDVYERPGRAGAAATHVSGWVPGFGGAMRWVAGDRLWHSWGCGTACVNARLHDVRGVVLFRTSGASALWDSPDGRASVAATHSGIVEVVNFATARTTTVGPTPPALFPIDLVWRASEVRVRFHTAGSDYLFVHAPLP